MFHIGLVLSHLVGSKAVVDKIQLSEDYYQFLDKNFKELDSWMQIFSGVDIKKPITWITAGVRTLKKVSVKKESNGKPKKNPLQDFRDRYHLTRKSLSFIEQVVFQVITLHNIPLELGFSDNSSSIYRANLSEDLEDPQYIYYQFSRGVVSSKDSDQEGEEGRFDDYYPDLEDCTGFLFKEHSKNDYLKFLQARNNFFWKDFNHWITRLKDDSNYMVLDPFEIKTSRKYKGDLENFHTYLAKAKEQNIRRNILFQGSPGTGKSTLVSNLAEKISSRTIVLTSEAIRGIHTRYRWEIILSLEPDMIIIDDIDRIKKAEQDFILSLIEDRYCQVPFILMTSNNLDDLSDAFKRPGRIDEIWELDKPSVDIRMEVLKSLAEQEGIDIPESRLKVLDDIYQNYTGAYLVEIFRRAKISGWNFNFSKRDLTFKDLSDTIISEWNSIEN